MDRAARLVPLLCLLVLLCLLIEASCVTGGARSRQLARVAKDWALTIRASQVLPVYPLTEDLEPGDVFLGAERVEDQVRLYRSEGFLPFEQLLVRLHPRGYSEFYDRGFGTGTDGRPPFVWRDGEAAAESGGRKGGDERAGGWKQAPHAAFPSYTFSIRKRGGVDVALPVQGIAAGLSLLGSSQVTGSVLIAEAYTYGLDDRSLRGDLLEWAKENSSYLRNFEPGDEAESRHYLRVVTRVYLARRVGVLLQQTRAAETGLSGDREIATRLQGGLDRSGLGEALKVVSATDRSVSIDETFEHPLVVGYLAFDMPILAGGVVGAPVSTLSLVTGRAGRAGRLLDYVPPAGAARCLSDWLEAVPEAERPGRRSIMNGWLQEQGVGLSATTWLHSRDERREAEYERFIRDQEIRCEQEM